MVPLNLTLHHRTILLHHLQINMVGVLNLDSFLGLFVGYGECWSLPSCCFTKGVPGLHQESTQAALGVAKEGGGCHEVCLWILKSYRDILLHSKNSPMTSIFTCLTGTEFHLLDPVIEFLQGGRAVMSAEVTQALGKRQSQVLVTHYLTLRLIEVYKNILIFICNLE